MMVRITEQILEEGKSSRGSWSKKQLQALGIKRYCNKGWKEKLIGLNVPIGAIEKFLALKDKHLKHNLSVAKRKSEKTVNIAQLIEKKQAEKAAKRRRFSLKLMENYIGLYDCGICIHGLSYSCVDHLPNGCEYFFDAETGRSFQK